MTDALAVRTLVRVFLTVSAVSRLGRYRVSTVDLGRLIYFTDAFSSLWGLSPVDPVRLKAAEPSSLEVRQATDRLVFAGLIAPQDVAIATVPWTHVTARFELVPGAADALLASIQQTEIGRREAVMVDEVVFASAGLIEDGLAEAIQIDAGFGDSRLGTNDLVLLEGAHSVTSRTALSFEPGVVSQSLREAELTHLYMRHLERIVHDS